MFLCIQQLRVVILLFIIVQQICEMVVHFVIEA